MSKKKDEETWLGDNWPYVAGGVVAAGALGYVSWKIWGFISKVEKVLSWGPFSDMSLGGLDTDSAVPIGMSVGKAFNRGFEKAVEGIEIEPASANGATVMGRKARAKKFSPAGG